MKRVWFGVGIAAAVAAFSLYTLFFSISIAARIESDLKTALSAAEKEDWETVSRFTENAYACWREKRPVLNVFFHHDPLELIEVSLDNLSIFSQYQNREVFHVKCSEAIKKISCIRDCDLPVLGNIL